MESTNKVDMFQALGMDLIINIIYFMVGDNVRDDNGHNVQYVPSYPAWAAACSSLCRVSNTMSAALRQSNVFKGEFTWKSIDPPTGYNIACSLSNIRELEWNGGKTVETDSFNLELHQYYVDNGTVVTIPNNDDEDENHVDPTGNIGVSIIRRRDEFQPRIIMWCFIDDTDCATQFFKPLMAFNTEELVGKYYGVELNAWNAVRALSLRDVRYPMYKMTELLHSDNQRLKIKFANSMQTWNTWNAHGEIAEMIPHRTYAAHLKVVPSTPLSYDDDFHVNEMESSSPTVLFGPGMEQDVNTGRDANHHYLNTGFFSEWITLDSKLQVTYAQITNHLGRGWSDRAGWEVTETSTERCTLHQKLVIRNIEFDANVHVKARESKRKSAKSYSANGDFNRSLSKIAVLCGYSTQNSMLRLGDGYFRIATADLVFPLVPKHNAPLGAPNTTEYKLKLKESYEILYYTGSKKIASSIKSTQLALCNNDTDMNARPTRKAASKSLETIRTFDDNKDSDSDSSDESYVHPTRKAASKSLEPMCTFDDDEDSDGDSSDERYTANNGGSSSANNGGSSSANNGGSSSANNRGSSSTEPKNKRKSKSNSTIEHRQNHWLGDVCKRSKKSSSRTSPSYSPMFTFERDYTTDVNAFLKAYMVKMGTNELDYWLSDD
jgi:hypothetical protein